MKILDELETRRLVEAFYELGSEAVSDYRALLKRLDRKISELTQMHRSYLQCRPGCDSCCKVNRTVLPVEAFYLWKAARSESFEPQQGSKEHWCPLLRRGLCVLYPARPVLCRTHGLPLLYVIDGNPGVVYCPLNFRSRKSNKFASDEVLDMEAINTELFKINARFVAQELHHAFPEGHRVQLRTLFLISSRPRGSDC